VFRVTRPAGHLGFIPPVNQSINQNTFIHSFIITPRRGKDGTGSPGHGSPGQRFWQGRVGPRVSVSDLVFDPVLSFNMRVYRGVVSTE